ncbi:NAD(+) synthase [Amorphus orientalis]|uniref:Glutamine-dependent NAD(+) synthetase n=1 Tax=Amorphus orientalis TaxID=649198 RepID=A0AAE3VQA6_9HYPH|nr:NAD(+) synthase [Amorphus orientalis]MDQ0316186.1 NAD+ synthase (glutamine-hydrolyzing) [Amorphus orientalis]
MQELSFHNLYRHGFVRVATATPEVALADPAANAERVIAMAREAHDRSVAVVLFPELCLSGYAIDDLLQQGALLEAVETALKDVTEATRDLRPMVLVGAPLVLEDRLFNTAVAIHKGRILGIVPKAYLPNYREFYEGRHFSPASATARSHVRLFGEEIPFGTDLLFDAPNVPGLVLHAEVCEDVWVPIPPSTHAALAGATVLLNLSASNVTIGKSDYRHALCRVHSARCFAAYLYSAAGAGESTTDLAWDGHAMIYENGSLLAESERFLRGAQLTTADVDVGLLVQERIRHGTFGDCAAHHEQPMRRISFDFEPPSDPVLPLARAVPRFPYVPADPARLDELCFEAYNIQVSGLAQRLASTGIKRIVIGVSGGLDSTQALLVACQAFDEIGLPRENILAYTLPAFATSASTRENAWDLMRALGVSADEIDMTPVCRQTLEDIGHPFAKGQPVYDITFENVQAGARTATLFRLANFHNALVLGTGDLSELALGWATYGVGDHMSHYNVNASVPKTLIQHLIRWAASTHRFSEAASAVALKVLDTEISPELVPGDADSDKPAQRTEDFVGPYELQDFNLYHVTRHGCAPSKVAFLSLHAWKDSSAGAWPPNFPEPSRNAYDLATVRKWLRVFLHRFFQTSQFKRSAVPNGPKVGSGGSLSPRGDWRAPSDASAKVWLEELDRNVPES